MREAFDDDVEQKDTEITLGLPSLLGIFFGLVLICGIFFGFGYTLGRGSSRPGNTANPSAATPQTSPDSSVAPDSALPKPSAQQAAPPAAAAPASMQASSPTVTPAVASTAEGQQPGTVLAATAPATASVTTIPTAAQAPPSASPAQQYMVQVAAVQNPADAAVLMNALRQRGYPAVERRLPQDSLMHVQIGPFSNRKAANQMRQRLEADGYNAILKP